MSVDRELLWKAWPDGYLAMRGVQTLGHWQCRWAAMGGRFGEFIRAEGNLVQGETGLGTIRRIIVHSSEATRDDQGEHARGDLLPLVDPTDTATWACLLQDLASALGLPQGFGYRWFGCPSTGWELHVFTPDGVQRVDGAPFIDIDASDPALALVLARIQLRETT
jgi:hypothetical protein